MQRPATERRSRVNLTVRQSLLAEARAAKLNLSRFVEEKLDEALRAERARRWKEENADAIRAYNARIEKDGMWTEGLTPWY